MNSKNHNIGSSRRSFAQTLLRLATDDARIYVVSMGLTPSLMLNDFAVRFPTRFIECGVAENNAAAVAAGLGKTNKVVFLATYSCFSPGINWSVIKQSICENYANVKIIGSHVGLLTQDLGASHQMLEDLSLMRSLPNMQVFAPIDALETEKIITTISRSPLPAYVRLYRPSTPNIYDSRLPFTIGKSHLLRHGVDLTIIGHGPILNYALELESVSADIINCSSIKPLDSTTIIHSVLKTGRLICLEDHQKIGGLGEAVSSLLLSSGITCRFVHLAIDNRFGQSGTDYHQLYDHYGIGKNDLINAIKGVML